MTKKYIITDDKVVKSVQTSDLPISATAVQTGLAGKVNLNQGTDYAGDFLKIGEDGIVTHASVVEEQVQANWNEATTTSPAYIQNKPTLGSAAAKDVAESGDASAAQVVLGNDSRLSNARAPTAHANNHIGSGSDAIPEATSSSNGLMSSADKTKLTGIEAGAQVNVIEEVQVGGVALDIDEKVVNVPIATTSGLGVVKVGTGLSITEAGLLTADVQLHFEVFDELPTASETYKNTIALVSKTGTTGDVYNEYVCVQDATTEAWAWELIGTTAFVLNITQTAAGITINGTALQAATTTQNGLMTKEQVSALAAAATQSDLEALEGRVETAEGDIEAIESDLDTAEGAIEALDGRLETAESDIDTLESGKVDKVTGSSLVADTKVAGYDAHLADTTIHVTASDKTTWSGKQNAITSDAKLSSDLVDDTNKTHKFVSAEEKETWNAKQEALTFDSTPTASSTNPVTSGGVKSALDAKVNLVTGSSVTIGKDNGGYYFNE